MTRKATYQHLDEWYRELRNFCQDIPVILVANKIDVNYKVSEGEGQGRVQRDSGAEGFGCIGILVSNQLASVGCTEIYGWLCCSPEPPLSTCILIYISSTPSPPQR